jgi:hypothetical protein
MAQLPEHGAPMDACGVEVAAQRPHRAPVGLLGVGDCDLRASLLLVGFGAADRDEQAAGGVEVEILDVERDELGAPERGGEPERGDVDRLEQARERLELKRLGFP